MEIIKINNLNPVNLNNDLCVAIGNFDGVHLGHQKLLEACKNTNLKTALLTFYPHPNTFIRDLPKYELLTPLDLKIKILEPIGIDYLIIVDFNEEMSKVSKEDFIKFMHNMNVKKIVCGYDFTFGFMASGTIEDLKNEFDTLVIKKYVLNDVRVSTTHIKDLLRDGELKKASLYLGRNHIVVGDVVHGSHKGKDIGFPTANIKYNNSLLPKNGVYFVRVNIDDIFYYGMANIGYNPTFNYQEERRLEVHIFNLDKDLYNKELFIEFIERIRPEKKYENIDKLIEQLNKDKEYCLSKI